MSLFDRDGWICQECGRRVPAGEQRAPDTIADNVNRVATQEKIAALEAALATAREALEGIAAWNYEPHVSRGMAREALAKLKTRGQGEGGGA